MVISLGTDYGHITVEFLILCSPNSNPNPKSIVWIWIQRLVFCRNNAWLMENMDKGLTIPKWVLINWPKIPQMPQNLFVQIVWPCPKVGEFDEKRLLWASLVRRYLQFGPISSRNLRFHFFNVWNLPLFEQYNVSWLTLE